MTITTREYTDQDKQLLITCIESLQKHIVDIDPLLRQIISPGYGESYTDALLKAIAEKDGKIYFAVDNNVAIGFIAGTIQPEAKGGTLEVIPSHPAWIRELYVQDEARGKGVGSLLIKTLEDYFKSKGCDVVLVGVFAPNTDSHLFYQAKGYVDREVTLLKKI
ncbi:MAG: hypothetical protein RL094_62 [Candidatus Parcubacteria bacterium]|jgi:GNAT superfamily N-acetyltransferase